MGRIDNNIKELINYLTHETDFGEDGIAIALTCNESEMSVEMLEYLKANEGIDWDSAIKKAIEIREEKHGKQNFVIDD